MEFDWDDANTSHIARHGVTPDEVEQVFANGPEEQYTHTTDEGEDRYSAQQLTDTGRELYVAFTYRQTRVRPITAYPVPKRKRIYAAKKSSRSGR